MEGASCWTWTAITLAVVGLFGPGFEPKVGLGGSHMGVRSEMMSHQQPGLKSPWEQGTWFCDSFTKKHGQSRVFGAMLGSI